MYSDYLELALTYWFYLSSYNFWDSKLNLILNFDLKQYFQKNNGA